MSAFQWTPKREQAAILQAQGYTIDETAAEVGVNERTIRRWREDIEFAKEVDRLSLMIGIASRSERLRMAMRIVRGLVKKQAPTNKDLLEWLKYVQGETDGVKLDLAALAEALSSVADGGQEGPDQEEDEPV